MNLWPHVSWYIPIQANRSQSGMISKVKITQVANEYI